MTNVFVAVLVYQTSNSVDFSLQMTLGQMKEHRGPSGVMGSGVRECTRGEHLEKKKSREESWEDDHCMTTSEAGDLWCHQEGCAGTYQPYRVNI